MNKTVKLSLVSLGGILLFSVAFVGFAKLRGAQWHELAVVGALFPEPPPGEPPTEKSHASEPAPEHVSPAGEELARRTSVPEPHAPPQSRARLSLLDAFSLESPYTSSQLETLAEALKAKNREAEQRLARIAEQEQLIADRMEALNEHQTSLAELRTRLEAMQEELRLRAEEVERDGSLRESREAEGWRARGKLFEEGEADTLVKRLLAYDPEDAAKILATLEPERARELLDALPEARWREYAETYSDVAARAAAR